jgi:hypothetical protein
VDEVMAHVDEALDSEIRGLRDAIARADHRLDPPEEPPEEQEFVVGALLSFNDEIDLESTETLEKAWAPCRAKLLAHLETEQRLILPSIRHVLNGKTALRAGLATPIRRMIAEHEEVSAMLEVVLNEAAPFEELYELFDEIRCQWDGHVDAQETVIFPETLEADTDVFVPLEQQLEDEPDAFALEGEPRSEAEPEPECLEQGPVEQPPEAPPPMSEAEEVGARLRAAAARRQAAMTSGSDGQGLVGRMRSLWERPRT